MLQARARGRSPAAPSRRRGGGAARERSRRGRPALRAGLAGALAGLLVGLGPALAQPLAGAVRGPSARLATAAAAWSVPAAGARSATPGGTARTRVAIAGPAAHGAVPVLWSDADPHQALADAQTPGGGAVAGASASAGGTEGLSVITQVYDLITEEYAGSVDGQALIVGAIKGMTDALGDPFSQYLPPASDSDLSASLTGFGGIGVALDATAAGPVVQSVEAGGPAYTAGIRSGDLIVSVDGHSTRGRPIAEVVAWLRGAPGSQVTLQVQGPGDPQPVQYVLTRVQMLPPSVFSQPLPDGVGLIRIASFTSSTAQEFDAAFRRLQAAAGPLGLHGLILDLRGNPGGLVDAALHVASDLAPAGPMLRVIDAAGNVTQYTAAPHPPAPRTVVLVDGGTASAAEILAGILQYTHTGVLVGSRTFGKASIQEIFPLPDGAGLKLTIAHDRLPDGRSWEEVGLTPDVRVQPPPPPWSQVPDFAAGGRRPLTRGMVGLDVLGLQQRLAFLGYQPGPASGVYGNRTLAAVGLFQKDHGLPVTGRVGARDWRVLDAAVAQQVYRMKVTPQPDVVLAKGLQVLQRLTQASG